MDDRTKRKAIQKQKRLKLKPQNLAQKLDAQVEQIVYKVMTNEGLEETIARAIKKALIELVVRYFTLIGFLVLIVLSLQVAMFIFIIKSNG